MELFVMILMAIAGVYFLVITGFYFGWGRLPQIPPNTEKKCFFSVVIAARNEQAGIRACLQALLKQDYPASFFEILVVDDHSTDHTSRVVTEAFEENAKVNTHLLRSSDAGILPGKKHAVSFGIQRARGQMIVLTDADCIASPKWLTTLNSWVQQHEPSMLIGPVTLWPADNLGAKMQALEFCSLSATTGGAAGIGNPVMCNGANLVFCPDTFNKVGGYTGNFKWASGDDMFLLQKFKKGAEKKIIYVKDPGAIVQTSPVHSINAFLRQRIRWASKTPGYTDVNAIMLAVLVALANILPLTGFFLALSFHQQAMPFVAGALLIKATADFLILFKVTGFFSFKKLMWLFPFVAVIYPFYVLISVAGVVFARKKPSWK